MGWADWEVEKGFIMGTPLTETPIIDYKRAAPLKDLAEWCHEANINFWRDLLVNCSCCYSLDWRPNGEIDPHKYNPDCRACQGTGYPLKQRNVGELLMLTVSELGEALEGARKDRMDEHLPHRKNFEVEIADAFIRLFDLCGGMNLDLVGAFAEKMRYNAVRQDHKMETRKAEGGKKF
jgi:NTP pyrophosphatase (non-canonical NTP hydrolase)